MLRSPSFYIAFACVALCLLLGALSMSRWGQAQTRGGIPAPKDDAPLANTPARRLPSSPVDAFGERSRCSNG